MRFFVRVCTRVYVKLKIESEMRSQGKMKAE